MNPYRRKAKALFDDGIIPPPTRSFSYLVGLGVVFILSLAMPIAYVGLIGLGAYLVFLHATANLDPAVSIGVAIHPIALVVTLGLYSLVLACGIAIVLFLVKPLFAPAGKRTSALNLNGESEPLLAAFIEEICEKMDVAPPQAIELSTDLSASASYRGGIRGVVTGDLVLTIGLPLVVGLDLRQFAGVIAHELGHFNQTISMRLSYWVRMTQAWFQRVAYERDAWDQALDDWEDERELGLIGFTLLLMFRSGVGTGRLLLAGLARSSQLGISFMLRQMEYNADRYGILLAGSTSYESLMLRLSVLSRAMHQMQIDMRHTLKTEGRLANNIAALLSQYADSLSDKVRSQWEGKEGLIPTRLFDTHPSAADRIREVRRMAAPGMVATNMRAIDLFQDFEIPARQVTLLYYQGLFSQTISPEVLYDVSVKADAISSPSDSATVNQRFYLGCLDWRRSSGFSAITDSPSESPSFDAEEMAAVLNNLQQLESPTIQTAGEVHQARQNSLNAQRNWLLQSVRIGVEGLPDLDAANRDIESTEHEEAQHQEQLNQVWTMVQQRVQLGMQALAASSIREHLPAAKGLSRQVTELLDALNQLTAPLETVRALEMDLQHLSWLLEIEREGRGNQHARTRQIQSMGESRHTLLDLEDQLTQVAYLFDDTDAPKSLWDHFSKNLPTLTIGNPISVYKRGESLLHASIEYHDSLAAALATSIEAIEAQLMPPTTD